MRSAIKSSLLGQLISAIQPIFFVPLFLSAWGSEGYGQWCIFFAVVSYFSLLDFGCQSHIGNILTEDFIKKYKKNFQANLSNSVSFFVFISGAIFVILMGILTILIIFSPDYFSKKNQIEHGEWILIFLAGNMLLSIPAGIYSTAYRAFGRVARVTMISNILRLIQLCILGSALYLEISPLGYSMLFFLLGVIGAIVNIIDLRLTFGEYVHIKISFSNAINGLKFLRGASYFWFLSLIAIINQQSPILVLGLFTSPLAVSLYVTHKTISNCLSYVGPIFQLPLWPEFSRFLVNGEKEKVFGLTLLCVRVVFFCTGVLALFIWFIAPDFYSTWTSKKLALDAQLLLILLIQGSLLSFWGTSSWSLMAGSRQNRLVYFSVLNTFLTLFLSILLSIEYGVIGCALASLISDVIFGLYFFPLVVSKAMGRNVKELFLQSIKVVFQLALCGLFLYLINLNYWNLSVVLNIILMTLVGVIFIFLNLKKDIMLMEKARI